MAETESLLTDHITAMYLQENLDFVINLPKLELTPTQEIEFLGFTVSSTLMEITLPGGVKQAKPCEAIPKTPLYYRNLQSCLGEALHENQAIPQ